MSTKRRTALQRMDALVWWSKGSDRVRHDMSGAAEARRHRPMRWLPLLPMAFGAGLIAAAIAFPVPFMLLAIAGPVTVAASGIATRGPLGKASIDDDEREAALRKNALFVCLAVLACANIVGGPILLATAALQGWSVERAASVAFALFMGNMTWFASLPALYASWKLPRLAGDDA